MMTQMHQQTLAKADCCGLCCCYPFQLLLHFFTLIYIAQRGEDLLLMAEYHVIFHGLFCPRPQKAKAISHMSIIGRTCRNRLKGSMKTPSDVSTLFFVLLSKLSTFDQNKGQLLLFGIREKFRFIYFLLIQVLATTSDSSIQHHIISLHHPVSK